MQVLVKYTSCQQTRQLCADAPELLTFLLVELAHALAQADRWNRKYTTNYHSSNFLELLATLCATSDSVANQLVPIGLVKQLAAALNVDVRKANADSLLKGDVLFAAKCTYAVLLVENAKYKDIIMSAFGGIQGLSPLSIHKLQYFADGGTESNGGGRGTFLHWRNQKFRVF